MQIPRQQYISFISSYEYKFGSYAHTQDNFGFDLTAMEAAAKKHEAIETDIFAYEERVQNVVTVCQELETENYHDIDRINARYLSLIFLLLDH